MEVTCTCGTTFEARHAKARYCSDRCRKRKVKADAAGAEVVALPTSTEEKPPRRGAVEAATVAALEEADRLGSPLGAMCVALARRLDFPVMDTGSAMAAVAKQLEALLTSATKGAGAATAPRQLQDELAERRRRQGA